MWQLAIAPLFVKSARKLPAETRRAIDDYIAQYVDGIENPQSLPRLKKLRGYSRYYRLRFGAYRVGIELDAARQRVIFWYVGARGDFYKNFPRG
ncbi:type II toxin-antitoxin system RelE family toxin [Endothiovibrio diazotrophicus]